MNKFIVIRPKSATLDHDLKKRVPIHLFTDYITWPCVESSWNVINPLHIFGSMIVQLTHTWHGQSCTYEQSLVPKDHQGLDLSAESRLTIEPAIFYMQSAKKTREFNQKAVTTVTDRVQMHIKSKGKQGCAFKTKKDEVIFNCWSEHPARKITPRGCWCMDALPTLMGLVAFCAGHFPRTSPGENFTPGAYILTEWFDI